MHIVDGALSLPVIVVGSAITVAGIGLGLRQMPMEKIPAAGVLSATFFCASLVHMSVGPSSVHLIINGSRRAGARLGGVSGAVRRAAVAGDLLRLRRPHGDRRQHRRHRRARGDRLLSLPPRHRRRVAAGRGGLGRRRRRAVDRADDGLCRFGAELFGRRVHPRGETGVFRAYPDHGDRSRPDRRRRLPHPPRKTGTFRARDAARRARPLGVQKS